MTQGGAGMAVLPWPPREDSIVSPDAWTTLELKGMDYASIGGAYEIAADLIRLKDGDGLAWALYSIPAGPALQPLSLTLNYGLEPRTGGDNCDAWLALANYSLGRWELHKADAEPYIFALTDAKSYVSPGGHCHAAVVFDGEGKVRVDSLLFQRYVNPPDSPSGFRLSVASGAVELAWDASAGADGYRLYKSPGSDFSAASLLTETQALAYNDSAVATPERWFYWTTALQNSAESLPSGPLCALLPEIDLPAPKDFWSPGSGVDSFDLAWDWEGPDPDGFKVYMSREPNFDPAGPGVDKFTVAGSARALTIGSPYVVHQFVNYCRVAAYDIQGISTKFGAWSKALPCVSDNHTAWQFPETLGPGSAPVRAAKTADGLVAAWFDTGAVMCGRRDSGGTWTVSDTGLNPSLETYSGQPLPSKGFDQYLDIARYEGVCLVCAHSADTGDLWAAIGNPGGGWLQELALGDRDPLGGTNSGVNLDCAAGPGNSGTGEYSVTCAVFPRDGHGFPPTFLASRPAIGGAEDWRSFDLSAEAPQLDSCDYPCCDYRADTGALYLLLFSDTLNEDGSVHETVRLGSFDPSVGTSAPQYEREIEDGSTWFLDPYTFTNRIYSSQAQLAYQEDWWLAPGFSFFVGHGGSAYFKIDAQDHTPGSETSTADSIFEPLALAGESYRWFPRTSYDFFAETSILLSWNETRQENVIDIWQFPDQDPPYQPIPLPGQPGPLADIICADGGPAIFLYADLTDGMVKCSPGNPAVN